LEHAKDEIWMNEAVRMEILMHYWTHWTRCMRRGRGGQAGMAGTNSPDSSGLWYPRLLYMRFVAVSLMLHLCPRISAASLVCPSCSLVITPWQPVEM